MGSTFKDTLFTNRFELFFFSQLAIMFGSLLVPYDIFEEIVMPILFIINIGAGILLISKNKKLYRFFIVLFSGALLVFGFSFIQTNTTTPYEYVKMGIYFLFYAVVTIQIIKQVWKATDVNKNVIFGLMSGYISLGLIAFFIFLGVEIAHPGSFSGLLLYDSNPKIPTDSLLYYSYITLMTIGYGEIYPTTAIAQKAAILVGLMGQFYLVIITAVVVEKYIRYSVK